MQSVLAVHQWTLAFLRRRGGERPLPAFLREFLTFGYKEAISCIFPAFIILMLAITKVVEVPFLYRYDFLLLMCFVMQIFMVRSGLESKKELLVICFFHLLGVTMEIYKVAYGSWAYTEPAYTKVYGVPLFSGFMYASVASYVCQAWKNFELEYDGWPTSERCKALGCLIYGNFYTNQILTDLKVPLIVLMLFLFRSTTVYFTTNGHRRKMPMVLAFVLISFFLWLAENIATLLGVWTYPDQHEKWTMVRLSIMSSWFLLVIVSVIIVAELHGVHKRKALAFPDGITTPR